MSSTWLPGPNDSHYGMFKVKGRVRNRIHIAHQIRIWPSHNGLSYVWATLCGSELAGVTPVVEPDPPPLCQNCRNVVDNLPALVRPLRLVGPAS